MVDGHEPLLGEAALQPLDLIEMLLQQLILLHQDLFLILDSSVQRHDVFVQFGEAGFAIVQQRK